MFYGLSKFFKNILPKRLFYRALLIVAVPVIVLQLVITIVFFDSLWIKTNKGMTKALVNEINTFIEVYSDEIYKKDEIKNVFSVYQDLNIDFIDNKKFTNIVDERWFSPIDRTLSLQRHLLSVSALWVAIRSWRPRRRLPRVSCYQKLRTRGLESLFDVG